MERSVRISFDPSVIGGKPCIRGMRITVGTVVGLVAGGKSDAEIVRLYPYLEADDIRAALEYATWRVQEATIPLSRTSHRSATNRSEDGAPSSA
jgi:uncharacterized protein (DUF433 family)